MQFGSPEAAVRGGVSAALDLEVLEDISQKGVCANIAVMQGESSQRDGSTSFADRLISARRSLP